MKLLLTSAGVKNTSIHDALVDLLGKPIAESSALCIPTAAYGHPQAVRAWHGGSSAGRAPAPMCELGWKSMGVLELTALPSIDDDNWVPLVRETDVLLVNGGDPMYLCHWMRESGLADLLPSLQRHGLRGAERREHGDDPPHRGGLRQLEAARRWRRHAGNRRFLDLPAPRSPGFAGQHHGRRRKMGGGHAGPAYAIDDQTAIKVVDGTVDVVSEGHWKLFTPDHEVSPSRI